MPVAWRSRAFGVGQTGDLQEWTVYVEVQANEYFRPWPNPDGICTRDQWQFQERRSRGTHRGDGDTDIYAGAAGQESDVSGKAGLPGKQRQGLSAAVHRPDIRNAD